MLADELIVDIVCPRGQFRLTEMLGLAALRGRRRRKLSLPQRPEVGKEPSCIIKLPMRLTSPTDYVRALRTQARRVNRYKIA